MKRTLKSLLLVMCMLAAMFAMTACGSRTEGAGGEVPEMEAANYKSAAEGLISQIAGFTDEDIELYLQQNDAFTTSVLESWKSVKDELGGFSSIISQDVSADGDIITVTTHAQYEKGKATIDMTLDTAAQAYTGMTFNVDYSLGVLMQRAGMNTVMGIGIVFLMLLFLSLVIGLFQYISKAQSGASKKETPIQAPAPAPAMPEEEELADDTELVAVIAAAIAAYEGSSTDSFVVRSIKKSNKWRRA